MARGRDGFRKPVEEPVNPLKGDIGCSLHGYAICSWCDWRSPSRRREGKPKTKCAVCAEPSQGFKLCQECTNRDRVAEHLFLEDGSPNLNPYESEG